ncbi:MAG: DUF255 domain-containing protein [Flammeovirgaceae bacterium]|nr:DUF255 domain-containing protein [Flammeovirgaceae bacterium]
MQKRFIFFFLFTLSFSVIYAQILTPSKWEVTPATPKARVGDEIDILFHVKIDDNWYLYSSEFDCEDGPMKTTFDFIKDPSFQLVGKVSAINPVDKFDDVFECDVKIFKKTAEFRQRIKILTPKLKISGTYEFQVCTEVDGRCIPGDGEFLLTRFDITGSALSSETPKEDETEEVPATTEETPQPEFYGNSKGPYIDATILDGEASQTGDSMWGYMFFAFILGFASLITPCVFPMIPMTVTFFLKEDQTKSQGIRKGVFFGISVIVIYTIAGTLFALLFGAEGLNALATHWIPNLFVFAIFIVFALSFLGMFEITAPHQLVNKADQQSEKGGLVGIFFMASTLVLVSFSCTIPIVGNVLVLSAGGEVIKPVVGMFSYALAFAIPFTLFAIFPEWLKGMPKSGGWLNSVKVTLGFLELALALKFFSIADQTYHWGLLDRDLNIALWIVIFTLLGFYFLGKLRMPSDSPVEKVSVPRLLWATLTFSFVVYLIPGLWGAPLKALAGYLPPMHTHDFDLVSMARGDKSDDICGEPLYGDFLHLPHGLKGYFDYDQALTCARQQNKPLFIDFTGHGCTNCREMEAVVWSDPQVMDRLKNDFVVVALYVDDKTELPESEWYTSAYDGKLKKTMGKQNADLQITNLENNAQPFYILLGKDERVLAWPYAYNRDVESFVRFLDSGKAKFKELY